jgi:excisionase family DNA binding protein
METKPDYPFVMTVNEVATLFRVHPATIKRLCKSGKLPHLSLGKGRTKRFSRTIMLEFLRAENDHA